MSRVISIIYSYIHTGKFHYINTVGISKIWHYLMSTRISAIAILYCGAIASPRKIFSFVPKTLFPLSKDKHKHKHFKGHFEITKITYLDKVFQFKYELE